jgi:hypothetical protein
VDVTDEQDSRVLEYCRLTGINHRQLVSLGKEAERRDYVQGPHETPIVLVEGEPEVSVMRRLRSTWAEPDGTMQTSAEDESARYLVGPEWKEYSCAYDTCIMAAILLDAGRCQQDQIQPRSKLDLSTPEQIIRIIVSGMWGTKASALRNQSRNALRDSIREYGSGIDSVVGADVLEIFRICFATLPQFSWTEVLTRKCCDGQYTLGASAAIRRICIEIGGHLGDITVEEYLNARFSNSKVKNMQDTRCTNGEKCLRQWEKCYAVLDNLPGRLMIGFCTHIGKKETRRHKVFHTLVLRARERWAPVIVRYEPVGCVLVSGKGEGTHFVLRWRRRQSKEQLLLYDGLLQKGRLETVPFDNDWFHDCADRRVRIVIYERIGI